MDVTATVEPLDYLVMSPYLVERATLQALGHISQLFSLVFSFAS